MKKVLSAVQAKKRLRQFASKEARDIAMWFFKTGTGAYGEHDQFIGVKVPNTRVVAREFKDLSFAEIQKLLKSEIHEDRLLALIILANRMKRAPFEEQERIAKVYIKNLKHVNNWDLVDSSAEYILGAYLKGRMTVSQQRVFLKKLALSKNLWFRRIAIMTTFHFIRHKEFQLTFYVAEMLLRDKHDLIHKATGWMIREVANRDFKRANKFLKTHYSKMPRTMLRYAIEKFPETQRKAFLLGQV